MYSRFIVFLISLLMVFNMGVSVAFGGNSNNMSTQDLIKKEEFMIKELSEKLDKIQNKYFEYKVMNFNNLEKRRNKAYEAYSSAQDRDKKNLDELHLKYLEALHFELKQKLLTLEGIDALTFDSMKSDFWQGVYEDVDWIVKNLDWSNVFKNITDCFKELDKDKCLDITGHITNFVLELVDKTWKRRFIVDMEKRINATQRIAEYLWDSMVMPKIDDMPAQKIMDKIGEKMNDKLKEKLQKEVEKRLKELLLSGIEKYKGLTPEEVKKKIEEDAKSKADSLFAAVVFGTDLLKKSIQIWIGEELVEDQLATQKRLIELARMAANYECRNKRHKDVCDDVVNKYYFDRKALAKKLKEMKASSNIPATPNAKGYIPPNSNGIDKIEKITKTVNPGRTKTKERGCKVDVEKYRRALMRIDNLFSSGGISYDEYLEAFGEITYELNKQIEKCYGYHVGYHVDSKTAESLNGLNKWYERRQKTYFDQCYQIRKQLEAMFDGFYAKLNKYKEEGEDLAKKIKKTQKEIKYLYAPSDYDLLERKKSYIEDMLDRLDDVIEECRKYVDDFTDRYESFAEANFRYFFEEGSFKPSGCLGQYNEPYSWGYETKKGCNFNVDPLRIGIEVSQVEDKIESKAVSEISLKEGDKDKDTKGSYQKYLHGEALSLVQKAIEKRRQTNKLFVDYLQSLSQIIDPKYIEKQRKLLRKDIIKIVYLDKDYRTGKIDSRVFAARWGFVASDIKKRFRRILYVCKLIKDGMPDPWQYSGHNEKIKQLLAELSKRAKRINDTSKHPLFSMTEAEKIKGKIDADVFKERWSVRDFMYFVPKNALKNGGVRESVIVYIDSKGTDRIDDCLCSDCYCCWDSYAKFMYKFLDKYPKDVIAARNIDTPIVKKKCDKVRSLNRLLDSLDKRYDNSVYRKAERLYKDLFKVDSRYVASKLYRFDPFLKYPCRVYFTMKRFENYSAKPVHIDPDKDFYEIKINSTPLSKLKKLFRGSNFIKIYSDNPNLTIKTYRVSDKLERFTTGIYLRVCPIIVYGSSKNEELKAKCNDKPMIKVSSDYRFSYVYKMPIKKAVYRIEVAAVLKDRTSIEAKGCPVSVYWIPNSTDEDEEEGETASGYAKNSNYTQTTKTSVHSTHVEHGSVIGGQKPHVIGNKESISTKKHTPPTIKDTPQTSNDCRKYYRDYVKAYNRLTGLMSKGMGNTEQAKDAYKAYKKARQLYASCKNHSGQNITKQPQDHPKMSKNTHNISNYIGCFKDKGDPFGLNGRDLNGTALFNDSGMTVEKCVSYCKSKGFKYAGVQYSSQCFCGNIYGKYGHATNCNMRCSGNKSQICGGTWANSIYKTGANSNSQTTNKDNRIIYNTAESGENFLNNNKPSSHNHTYYLGCFKDKGDPYGLKGRDLAAFGFGSDRMTPYLCMRECARRGYRYAGVQYSGYCFCGNRYGRYGRATNCNMRCSGNKSQICGGSWANNVYDTSGLNVPRLHYGSGVEPNTDRPGLDYKNFNLPYPDYRLCQNACNKDPQCKAWTYVKPYTIQGAYARCWLKNAIPNPVKRNCCVSGIKRNAGEITKTFKYPRINGYRLDWCRLWAQDCGKGAADAFCKRMGFERAVSFEEDYDIGAKSPTYVIDSGKICNQSFCDGFKYITCAGRRSLIPPKKHKQIQVQSNTNKNLNCKDAYRRFVHAYNKLVNLMSKGKGNTPEAVDAKKEYDAARNAYANCKNAQKKKTVHYSINKCAVYQDKQDYISMHYPEYLSAKKHYINLTCSVYMLPTGSRIKAEWYYVTPNQDYLIGQKTVAVKRTSPKDKYVNFRIENNREWPAGVYRVRITLNGKEVDVISFKVR